MPARPPPARRAVPLPRIRPRTRTRPRTGSRRCSCLLLSAAVVGKRSDAHEDDLALTAHPPARRRARRRAPPRALGSVGAGRVAVAVAVVVVGVVVVVGLERRGPGP